MPRASRHYIPGYVWHLTHRCHKKEFLLKFGRDRRRWLWWLFEAKKRYGLSVVGYTVTSNHIHLLVRDSGGKDVIAKSIQLVAGRTGQDSNDGQKHYQIPRAKRVPSRQLNIPVRRGAGKRP